MSFEPYQENGALQTNRKIAPVKIVINKNENTEIPKQKYPPLSLSFPLQATPSVTIPLSFLQQLIQQAQMNKILQNQLGDQQMPIIKQSVAVDSLITQIQSRQHYMKPMDEEKKIKQYLLRQQMQFIRENKASLEQVQNYFADNQNLLPHFMMWLRQIELKALEDMLFLCYTHNHQKIADVFKGLFQQLSIEYYQKHAYAEILRSNLVDKIPYLSTIGDILSKIVNPQDYFYFNK